MSEAQPAAEGGEAQAPSGGKKSGLLIALTFGGALLGGLVASFLVAPKIIARQATATAESTATGGGAEGEEDGEGTKEGGKDRPASSGKIVALDNIIVNPSGSQGTRFLMVGVAFAVENEEVEKRLHAHEVELRDKVTGILESQTLQMLTTPGARDTLKIRIAAVAQPLAGPKAVLRVFLPQFVIQ